MAYPTTDALGYERLMGRWSCLLAEPFLDFTGHGDEEQVLDIGCGTGNLTRALAARTCGGGLTGVDLSPVYVAYAQGHTSDSRCSFYENDATHLMFADGRFDRVLSLLVLQFIPDWQTALAEMRRVAKPGAIIGAAVWDNRGGFVSQRLFWDTAAAVLPHAIEQRTPLHLSVDPSGRTGQRTAGHGN
jgi:ubiquinone/menaquinone biosynthesis C-methylase UbiE